MARLESQRRATKKWNDANMSIMYDRITTLVPKGEREVIKTYAESKGMGLSGYIKTLILADMGRPLDEWDKRPMKQDKPGE